ncbi:MAG: hypothetical protein H7641_02170 [Candidatus Heimdallarchaeota archaeon]|nr:hypothetical protein [Candidatus Heimdallarchaeota archaeon]MCK4876370.1 hypothetical protein [Candidatus Heimdallarchaeota archaeon]
MNSTEKTPAYTKPALYLGAFLLSLVGGILFLVLEFGWWQEIPSGSYYNFALYGQFVPWYGKVILVIMGLLYLFVAFATLQKLYPFLKIDENKMETLEKGAFYAAIVVVILTILTAIIFGIMVGEAIEWDFGTPFYTGLIGGVVTVLFLVFARRLEAQT